MSAQLTMVDVITLATIQLAVTPVPVVLVTISLLMGILVKVRLCIIPSTTLSLGNGVSICVDDFLDINECEMNISECDHYCNNTLGSYNCSCQLGFLLAMDNVTCIGEKELMVDFMDIVIINIFIIRY